MLPQPCSAPRPIAADTEAPSEEVPGVRAARPRSGCLSPPHPLPAPEGKAEGDHVPPHAGAQILTRESVDTGVRQEGRVGVLSVSLCVCVSLGVCVCLVSVSLVSVSLWVCVCVSVSLCLCDASSHLQQLYLDTR